MTILTNESDVDMLKDDSDVDKTKDVIQPISNPCVYSMESVDQVGRRERFMQSNFESLSGGDDQSLSSTTTNSISNAWREGSAHQRNAGTIGRTDPLILSFPFV